MIMEKEKFDSNQLLEPGERLDEIGFGGLRLLQKPEDFCYGVDAVILADLTAKYVRRSTETIVDLGTGTGIIPTILSYKTDVPDLIGVEVQNEAYERALRNVGINGLEERVSFLHGNVKDVAQWGKPLIGTVDIVTSNPPYTAGKEGMTSDNRAKMIARHEIMAGLEDFLRCAALLLKEKGDLFMVHRPARLVDICCFGRALGLEPKEMCFVSPNVETKPNILLVHMVKGGGRQLKMLPPFYVYDMDGNYTPQLRETYK